MENNEVQRVQAIQFSMGEAARPGFDDKDIEQLCILIRVTMEFNDYLRSAPPWPQFPDDPYHDMTYAIDKILINIDSFRTVLHSYGVLVGSTRSPVDWKSVWNPSETGSSLSILNLWQRQSSRKNVGSSWTCSNYRLCSQGRSMTAWASAPPYSTGAHALYRLRK